MSIPRQGVYPKVLKAGTETHICVLIFIPVLFILVKDGRNPSVHG